MNTDVEIVRELMRQVSAVTPELSVMSLRARVEERRERSDDDRSFEWYETLRLDQHSVADERRILEPTEEWAFRLAEVFSPKQLRAKLAEETVEAIRRVAARADELIAGTEDPRFAPEPENDD